MRRVAVWTALAVLGPALALGAPPALVLVEPRNGAWAGPRTSFVVRLDGGAPYGTAFSRVEYRVLNPDDTVAAATSTTVSALDDETSRSFTAPLDAGTYRWTARTLDSSDASVWAPPETFRWDGVSPVAPGFVTLDDLDAGYVRISYGPVVDETSGVAEYHPAVSFEGDDAGIDWFNGNLETTQLTTFTWLGPGTWRLAVHAHDLAGNIGATVETPRIAVVASPQLVGLTPTAPQLVFFDGGPAPTITNASSIRARWTSPFDGGVFVVGRRSVSAGVLAIAATRFFPSVVLSEGDDGLFELQVAHALDGQVTDWSPATRYLIDQSRPFTPVVSAAVDGGEVRVRWNGVNDRGAPASGVRQHSLTRTTAMGAVVLATLDAGLPQYEVQDAPGTGASTYTVRVFDVAGNVTVVSANVFIGAPPALEAPVATPAVSTGPVTVSWDGGGVSASFEVSREDGAGAATVVGAVAATSLIDAPPEGTWRYRVSAQVNGFVGPLSPASQPVVVDQTAPTASLSAGRRTASSVEVQWQAMDALSGLASVVLEREASSGQVTSLGTVTSAPVVDTPPDGVWRYRLTATDVAGNATTTPFSQAVTVPGPVIRLAPPAVAPLECYREAQVLLASAGEPAVSWALVSGPDGVAIDPVTGTLTWTPRNADVGRQVARVRVSGAGSVDEGDLGLEVTCQPKRLTVGCASAPMLAPLVIALWLAKRRRSR